MGQHRLHYHYAAEHYPARRSRLVTYWRHVHARTRTRYQHWARTPRALGQTLAAARGWTGSEWAALDLLWNRESGWNPCRHYPSTTDCSYAGSAACGIPQRKPCAGLILAGPAAQIRWGLAYIASRYGTPTAALAHSNTNGWY